ARMICSTIGTCLPPRIATRRLGGVAGGRMTKAAIHHRPRRSPTLRGDRGSRMQLTAARRAARALEHECAHGRIDVSMVMALATVAIAVAARCSIAFAIAVPLALALRAIARAITDAARIGLRRGSSGGWRLKRAQYHHSRSGSPPALAQADR